MAEHDAHKEEHGGGGGSHGGGGHGPGGGGHAEGEHEGAPEWLISFADNVALMMGFFVILLAMNMKKPSAGGIGGEGKMGGEPTAAMLDFVITMRKEFNNPIDMNSDNPAEAPFRKRMKEREAGLSSQPGDPGPGKEAQSIHPTDFTNGGGKVQFENNSSSLTTTARNTIRTIASNIKGQRFIIEVRGHVSPREAVDNVDAAFGLAHARTVSVAKELESNGIPLSQMRLSSCADNERKTTREQSYDADLDQLNQRVEIIVTTQAIPSTRTQLLPKSRDKDAPERDATPSDDEHSASSSRH